MKVCANMVGWSVTCWIVPLMLHLVLCMKYGAGMRLPHGEHLIAAIANGTLLWQPLTSPLGAITLRGSVWEMRLQRQQKNQIYQLGEVGDGRWGVGGQKWRILIGINRRPVVSCSGIHHSSAHALLKRRRRCSPPRQVERFGPSCRGCWHFQILSFCFNITPFLCCLFPHLLPSRFSCCCHVCDGDIFN